MEKVEGHETFVGFRFSLRAKIDLSITIHWNNLFLESGI